MKKIVIALCMFILLAGLVEKTVAKVYTRCGLTQELLQKGFSRSLVANWVCLIENESWKDTSQQTNKADGSKGLGLFQIRSGYWCKYRSPGGTCNIKCEDLIDDDITDDSACARKVQEKYGFSAWGGWTRNCYRRIKTYVASIARTCLRGP